MGAVVEIRALRRIYKARRKPTETVALDGVDLTVDEGEIHGLLGPNGAGKSTLVKVATTVLLPTSGSVKVLGTDVVSDVRRVRENVGVVFGGERGLYTRVTARRNLTFWSALYRLDARTTRSRTQQLLERVGLSDRADEPVEAFSRGMKQRLHLARGLLHDPRVLFLDEPTSGMDPVAAHDFRDLVRELRQEGRTVFLTTHDMAEAEALCDRVSLIDRGKLLLSDPTAQVAKRLGIRECVNFSSEDQALIAQLRALPAVDQVIGKDGTWSAFPTTENDTAAVMVWLIERGVLSAHRAQPSLEDVYLHLVGARGMSV